MLSPEQEEQQPWRCLGRYLLLQTSFVALTSKTALISASQALWESMSVYIMAVALFNPHCMQSITGRLLTFSIVRWGSHSCRKCPVWNNLLRVVPAQEKVLPLGPQQYLHAMCSVVWYRNLLQEELQGLAVHPHQEAMSKVEATNWSVWW